MSEVKVKRYEYGDIQARTDGPMTVADLIEALQQMPAHATVLRYCDWTIDRVIYEHPGGTVELH